MDFQEASLKSSRTTLHCKMRVTFMLIASLALAVVAFRTSRRCAPTMMAFGRGKGPKYSWTEAEDDLEVLVPIPEGLSAAQLQVRLNSSALEVEAPAGQELLRGTFREKIAIGESFWTLDGNILVLQLQKRPPVFEHDFQWGYVFKEDEDDPEIVRAYQADKEFDLDEYVESLGGYNESLVDRNAFGNVTEQILETMKSQGLVKDEGEDLPDNEEIFEEIDAEDGGQTAGGERRLSPNEKLLLDKIRREFGDDAVGLKKPK
eukprot:scaffold770_cov255-Pinguiococcus_pyrenoidosus.AAC.51